MKTKKIIILLTVVAIMFSMFNVHVLAASEKVSEINVSYSGGTTTTISGSSVSDKVLIVIIDSNGNQLALDNTNVIGGTFLKVVNTGKLTNGKVYNVKVCDLYGDSDYTEKSFTVANVPAPTPEPTSTPTPTPAPADRTDEVKETINTTAIIDSNTGKLIAQINEKQVSEALARIIEAAKKQENTVKTILGVKINVPETSSNMVLEFPKSVVETIVQSELDTLVIDAGMGILAMDKKTLKAINSAAATKAVDAKVSVSLAIVDTSEAINKYSDSARETFNNKIGDRPVYDFNIMVGDTKVSNFLGGEINITLPYTPKVGEDINQIVIYYVDDKGNLKCVPNSKYDQASKTISFRVKHFSRYSAAYNAVKFSDIPEEAWYNTAVSYMAARTVVNGMGDGRFVPGSNVTRADFLIMAMRTYGIEPDHNINNNFTDAENKYYTPYLATAKQLGLVSGVGNNMFYPEKDISRQDMLVILYSLLDKIGELPTGKNNNITFGKFKDSDDIVGYAKKAMEVFVETGTITGDGENLMPKATSTRAQAAQVMYNLISR